MHISEFLAGHVRDSSIEEIQSFLTRQNISKEWEELKLSADQVDRLAQISFEIVDFVIFYLLQGIDNDEILSDENSLTHIDGYIRGEYSGAWMMGEGGWIDQYSQHPYRDPITGAIHEPQKRS